MIYSIAIWVLTLTLKLLFDIKRWYSGKKNYHVIGAGIVFICLSAATYITPHPVWFLSYWALFDMLWGKITGNGWLYIGTTSKLDKLQKKYPVIMWAKIIGAAASIFFFIKHYLC